MAWSDEQQQRFDTLRLRALSTDLSPAEQAELDALQTQLADAWPLDLEALQTEQADLRTRLTRAQTENEALAQLLNQQEQLVAEARQWLARFESRHQQLRQTYTHLTGETLTATPAR